MSANHHPPRKNLQRLQAMASPSCHQHKHKHQQRSPALRPHIADLMVQLLLDIETFLITCTHEEIRSFWQKISHLRQHLHRVIQRSEIPCFLDFRRKNRDLCRILEVLADLTYPQMHLSNANPQKCDYTFVD
jgi:hypothetical protein